MVSITDPFRAIYGWFTSKEKEGEEESEGKQIITILEQIAQGNFSYNISIPKDKKDSEHVQILKGLQLTLKELKKFENREKRRRKQLLEANAQLRMLDQNKREFMELASHQLKTPLASLQLGLEVLQSQGHAFDAEHQNILEQIRGSYDHLSHIVHSVLEAVRIDERMAMEPTIKQACIHQVTDVLEKQFRPQLEAKDITFTIVQPQSNICFKTDPEFLIEILQNLLENSWKYTERGHVTYIADVTENTLEFRIVDSGIGIPKKEQKRICDKLFRASNVKNMSDIGSGLGLYYTKQLVKKLKGKLHFESQEGRGSTFFISIPLEY